MRFHKLLANYVYNKYVGKTYNILSGLLCRLAPKIFADFKVVLGRYQFVTSGIWYYKINSELYSVSHCIIILIKLELHQENYIVGTFDNNKAYT